jgi:hypothetical protein
MQNPGLNIKPYVFYSAMKNKEWRRRKIIFPLLEAW